MNKFYRHISMLKVFSFVLFWLIIRVGVAQEINSYTVHTQPISALGFSTDGEIIISAARDKQIFFHSVKDQSSAEKKGIADGKVISGISTSPASGFVAYKGWGDKIIITDKYNIIDEVGAWGEVSNVVFSPYEKNTLYFLDDNVIKKYIWPSKQTTKVVRESVAKNIVRFALCNKSERIVFVLNDFTVGYLENANQVMPTFVINEQKRQVTSIAVSRNDEYLALGYTFGRIEIYNLESGKFILGINDQSNLVNSLAFAPQGPYLASRSYDNSLMIWNIPDGKQIYSYEEGNTSPGEPLVVISNDGKYLVTNKDSKTVHYFDLRKILSDWLLKQGAEAAGLRDFKKAEEFYSNAIEVLPGYAGFYRRGNIRSKLVKPEAAIADFSEALKFTPSGKEAIFERCLLYKTLHKNEEALRDCNHLTNFYRQDSLYWIMKEELLLSMGRANDAIMAIDTAILYAKNPDNLRYLRACTLMKAGLFAEAITDFGKLILKQTRPEYLMNRSLCYYMSKNYAKAYEDLVFMGKLYDDYSSQKKFLAFSALLTGKYTEAQQLFSALRLNEKSENDLMLGSALACILEQKQEGDAPMAIGRLVKIQPNNYDLLFLRGLAFVFQNELADAYVLFSKVYRPKPDYQFRFRDTLCLNSNDAFQKSLGEILTIVSKGICDLKLDYSEKAETDLVKDYDSQVAYNQEKLSKVIQACKDQLGSQSQLFFQTASKVVDLKIDTIIASDKSGNRYVLLIKGKRYRVRDNKDFELMLGKFWRKAEVTGEQRYSNSLKQFEFLNLTATLRTQELVCSLIPEAEAIVGETDAVIAYQNKDQQDNGQRGIRNVSGSGNKDLRKEGKNYLLMIGVNNYPYWPKLTTPVADVKDLEKVLWERYQFTPERTLEILNEDFTRENLDKKFEFLMDSLTDRDKLLIYYAGHGVKDPKTSEGYWIPCNARLGARTDYIQNSQIVTYIRAIKAKHILLIMDACFSGTMLASSRGISEQKSLDKLEESPSRYALASGREENVDDVMPGTNHSPFAFSLINVLKYSSEDISIGDLGVKVGYGVGNNAKQQPVCLPIQNVGSLYGQFVFHLKK